jgi:hypothetical protein
MVSIDFHQPKIYPNQNNEASSLVNIPTQHADCLAALGKTLCFNQHCTGSKGDYGLASNIQLSGKNLDCQSDGGFNIEENLVNTIKDVKSNTVSTDFDGPRIHLYQGEGISNLDNNLSNISDETKKEKWKQKTSQKYRLLHSNREVETNYKVFNDLQPKGDLKQFEETINLGDTPIEFMDHLAALQETLSFN